MFKRLVLSFVLKKNVENETIDSINKSLNTFNNEPEDKLWDYSGYIAKCLNVKENWKHSVVVVEIVNKSNKLSNETDVVANCIQGYLEESPEVSISHYNLVSKD